MLFLQRPQASRRLEGTPGPLILGKFDTSVFTEECHVGNCVRLGGLINPRGLLLGNRYTRAGRKRALFCFVPSVWKL